MWRLLTQIRLGPIRTPGPGGPWAYAPRSLQSEYNPKNAPIGLMVGWKAKGVWLYQGLPCPITATSHCRCYPITEHLLSTNLEDFEVRDRFYMGPRA